MFTGLIQHIGTIEKNTGGRLQLKIGASSVRLGDSIAVNGVCLTVASKRQKGKQLELDFVVSAETLSITTLGSLRKRQHVNVEKALTLADSLGGHIVQGHVDGVGRVVKILKEKNSIRMWFEGPKDILESVVSKGSVTVDGVSLTAVDVSASRFSVALVPFTLAHTTLRERRAGDKVNLEADIIGKYVMTYLRKR